MNQMAKVLIFIIVIISFFNALSAQDGFTIPTVEPSMPAAEWEALFEPQTDCMPPCWLRIVPGETSLAETRLYLEKMFPEITFNDYFYSDNTQGLSSSLKKSSAEANSEGDLYYPIKLTLIGDSIGNLQMLLTGFSSGEYTNNNHLAWIYFDVLNLIEIYGVPDAIHSDLQGIEIGARANDLNLLWKDVSFVVRYDIFDSYRNNLNTIGEPICFDLPRVDHFRVEFWSEGHASDSLFLTQFNWKIEDLTDYDVEGFTELLVENDGCIPPDINLHSPYE